MVVWVYIHITDLNLEYTERQCFKITKMTQALGIPRLSETSGSWLVC